MPLRLSVPEREASVNVVQFAIPSLVQHKVSISLEAEEPITHTTNVAVESLEFGLQVPRSFVFIEPTFEDRTALSHLQENGKGKLPEIRVPTLEWLTRADPTLTVLVRKLVRILWAIVVSRAMQVGFPLRRTVVSVFEDPTEQERKAVLRVVCDANVVQALAFWDSLEPDLHGWLQTLGENDRTTFITKLSLRVHWR